MTVTGFAWPITIIAIIANGGDVWWLLILVPLILSTISGKAQQDRRELERRQRSEPPALEQ